MTHLEQGDSRAEGAEITETSGRSGCHVKKRRSCALVKSPERVCETQGAWVGAEPDVIDAILLPSCTSTFQHFS